MTALSDKSRILLLAHGASHLFLDILESGAEPPDFLEGIFHAPNEYFDEDEAIEYTKGQLVPLFDDGGPSMATFFNPIEKQFLQVCMEDGSEDTFDNWQQVLCCMLNQVIENHEADPISAARQTGFLYLEKLLEFRASYFQSETWDEQFSSFVATL